MVCRAFGAHEGMCSRCHTALNFLASKVYRDGASEALLQVSDYGWNISWDDDPSTPTQDEGC